MLLLACGSALSLGIFVVPVELSASQPDSLKGVWQTAMGALHFLSAPLMIIASIFLHGGCTDPREQLNAPFFATRTMRARFLVFFAALGYAAFSISGVGVLRSSVGLITLGVASQAIPFGICMSVFHSGKCFRLTYMCVFAMCVWTGYLLGMELLVAGFSKRPGLATGIGEILFALGYILGVRLLQKILTSYGNVGGIYVTAVLLAACAILPALLMRWPAQVEGEQVRMDDEERTDNESVPLLEDEANGYVEQQPLVFIMQRATFWLYIMTVLTGAANYGLFPYFFKLGYTFKQPLESVIGWFQIMGCVSIAVCLFSCMLMDYAKFGEGFWAMGSKNVILLLLVVQILCFGLLLHFSYSESYSGFVGTLILLSSVAVSQSGCSLVLAMDLFGKANGGIVFGVGAGLSMGVGEGFSAWLLVAVERAVNHVGLSETPADFLLFYRIGCVWSLLGLLSLLFCKNQKWSLDSTLDGIIV